MNRSARLLAWKSRSRWKTCPPITTITAKPRARPATAAHARRSFLASRLAGGDRDRLGMAVSVDGARGRRAFAMDGEIADGRMLAADDASRPAPPARRLPRLPSARMVASEVESVA